MVKIKNSKASQEEIKTQLKEVLTTYEGITGKRSICQYDPEEYEEPDFNPQRHDYDYEDADSFIYAFEEEFLLPHNEDNGDLEWEIHSLKARNNLINPMSAFRLCLHYWLDLGNWEETSHI